MPDPGPFGETFLEASDRAIVGASFVNKPFAGCVESVLTFATQRCPPFRRGRLEVLPDLFPLDLGSDMMGSSGSFEMPMVEGKDSTSDRGE
jgi:hypothetical protein